MLSKRTQAFRERKRAEGDVQYCPATGCEAEVWTWGHVYCSEACRKRAVAERRQAKQLEVKRLRAAGVSVASIAERLGITENGVWHRRTLRGAQHA